MKQEIAIRHEFVEFIPEELQEHTIYISIRFATASHLCCCGCGSKVVTPIRPTDWKLIFDGKTISLDPSIGNWSFACQSHYWIRNNRVKWAPKWSNEQIERGRTRDTHAKEQYFDIEAQRPDTSLDSIATPRTTNNQKRKTWRKLKWW